PCAMTCASVTSGRSGGNATGYGQPSSYSVSVTYTTFNRSSRRGSALIKKEGTGMATTDLALHEASGHVELKRIVNDMSIQVGTVNGSGSQSSNTVLLRTIFQM